MRNLKHSLRIAFSLLIIGLTLSELMAQGSNSPYMISPWVGETIDAFEMKRFGLFPKFRQKISEAAIFKSSSGAYSIHFTYKDGEIDKQGISEANIDLMVDDIEKRIPQLIATYNQLENMLKEGKVNTLIRLSLRGEDRVSGKISGISTANILLNTKLGEASVALEKILKIEFEGQDFQTNNMYGFDNPNATRYLFAPSAIPLEKGEGYYQNVWVTVNSINYGLTDHITVSGGLEMISTLGALTGNGIVPIGYANVKVGTQVSKNTWLGGGAMIAGAAGEGGLGIGYGLATFGDKEKNLTIGGGYATDINNTDGVGIITLSGMSRINRRLGFVSENWVIIDSNTYGFASSSRTVGVALSGGLRIMSEHITLDLALVSFGAFDSYTHSDGTKGGNGEWFPIPLPFLDVVYKF